MLNPVITDQEMGALLTVLLEQHGYDFLGYSPASVKRRLLRLMAAERLPGLPALLHRLRYDPDFIRRCIEEITVNVTEMFRDAAYYHCLRNTILPVLNTYPLIRIWHAGCSTGEEVYSMAILLQEEKLFHKCLLYATDLNQGVIEKARKGMFPLSQMKLYSNNYISAGGKNAFSQYYTANYGYAKFDASLSEKVIFATHNLVSDKSFNEFQLIICRNVLIYFNRELQESVLRLFDESLESLGFLALGAKETIRFSAIAPRFRQVEKEKIWRKM